MARTALGAATAAVLAVIAVAPSGASTPSDGASGKWPIIGSEKSTAQGGKQATVTLLAGDKVAVTDLGQGRKTAGVHVTFE
ncbi:hypothetical protein ACFU6I_38785 [Streptomyces sp. NPDC057486]|uniref:hypothetical protein n=1 Tax=Streptomyces sp. NPDC057486 TaxID=3346145 RepID=UPI0036CB640F